MRSNFPEIARRVDQLGRAGSVAGAIALTRSMKDAQGAVVDTMKQVFDRPTRYALNGTFIKPATKNNLEARLWVKDEAFKGTPAERFLGPQIFGGARVQKGMERLLERAGLMPAGWMAMPGAGAQLDANGNVKRSQVVQILSQLRLQRGAGFESRASNSTRSRRTVARQGVTYFALPRGNKGLLPGIYLKRRFALGSAIRPVFIFVESARYEPRLPFHEVATATVQARFPIHFDTELTKVITDARLR